jgi:hypothetical protein
MCGEVLSQHFIFVDTGLKGAAVLFRETLPLRAFRLKKNIKGRGIQLQPFIEFLKGLPTGTIPIIEDPPKVQRSLTTTSTQYIVVGQIISAIETELTPEMEWINANSWIAMVRRLYKGRRFKDNKERSICYAMESYPHWVPEGVDKIHDGIADCLCMASYYFSTQETVISKMKD